jgi:hypothetical protein
MIKEPAFQSGMRAHEAPPKHEGPKRKIKRIEIEPASNGGHIVSVHRHPKPAKSNEPIDFQEPEKHAHSNKPDALAHVNTLMDDMSPTP